MIEDLAGVIEDAAAGLADNLLKFQALKATSRQGCIEIIHIALQVLPVMESQSLGADHRLQCVRCVW